MKTICQSLYSTIFSCINNLSLSSIILWFINNLIVIRLTLLLTSYQENKKDKKKFNNRIKCLLKELELNHCGRGNPATPFFTRALDIFVHEEPLIHTDPILFEKAYQCLYKALDPRTSFAPRDGQILMHDLEEYLQEFQKKSYLKWYHLSLKNFKFLFRIQKRERSSIESP